MRTNTLRWAIAFCLAAAAGSPVQAQTSTENTSKQSDETLTEVIVTNHEPLTDRGLLQSIPCRGERYHEMNAGENIKYMISTQEEQLTQTLYDATKHEIATYAAKRELMSAEVPARDEQGASLSVLDIERRSHELLVQSFHLFDENQMVIKTQAIIEVVKNP